VQKIFSFEQGWVPNEPEAVLYFSGGITVYRKVEKVNKITNLIYNFATRTPKKMKKKQSSPSPPQHGDPLNIRTSFAAAGDEPLRATLL
jgi:hypothetical protein